MVLRLITIDTDVLDLPKILLGSYNTSDYLLSKKGKKKKELKKVSFWALLYVKKTQKKRGRKTEINFDIFYKN